MSSNDLRWLAVAIALVGLVLTLYRARKPGLLRPWLLYRAIILAYFASIYVAANTPAGAGVLALRDGSLSAAGVIMLLLAFIADGIAERRAHD